ncbi:hypothetical protein JG687_00003570, partial [Phytophthora cactorum]
FVSIYCICICLPWISTVDLLLDMHPRLLLLSSTSAPSMDRLLVLALPLESSLTSSFCRSLSFSGFKPPGVGRERSEDEIPHLSLPDRSSIQQQQKQHQPPLLHQRPASSRFLNRYYEKTSEQ